MEYHDTLPYYDEYRVEINSKDLERTEQIIADKFILPDMTVLELGGRYGMVSSIINSRLNDGSRHVVVEPDPDVIPALLRNRLIHGSNYSLFQGVITRERISQLLAKDGYASSISRPVEDVGKLQGVYVATTTVEALETQYGLCFDTLIADIEGGMETFVRQNVDMFSRMRLVSYEKDFGNYCDYDYVKEIMESAGLTLMHNNFHMIWYRET